MALPLQVGITGGIGSGKSTIVKIFNSLGVHSYDADSRAKILMNSDSVLIKQIKNEFGTQSFDQDGQLDRKYLASHVFGYPDRLKKLNSLVHPRVADDYALWVSKNKNSKYVIKEAALLYESGTAQQLDKIIVVTASESIRVDRVMKRDSRSKAEVMKIIDQQFPQDKLQSLAHFVIVNDESKLLIPQVLNLHWELSGQ